jgi:hypothetical protein
MNSAPKTTRRRNAARPLLCAAAFHAALLFSSNAAALKCAPQTPQSLSAQYQQADYVGQLKVLAHGTERKTVKESVTVVKMQVELVGRDVRGVKTAVARESKTNTQWAWIKASTAVGTVQDVIIHRLADFDAGTFTGEMPCQQRLFAAGTLNKLLSPKNAQTRRNSDASGEEAYSFDAKQTQPKNATP